MIDSNQARSVPGPCLLWLALRTLPEWLCWPTPQEDFPIFVFQFAFSIIHGNRNVAKPVFHRSSTSVYYTECKPKNKNWGRPGNKAKEDLYVHAEPLIRILAWLNRFDSSAYDICKQTFRSACLSITLKRRHCDNHQYTFPYMDWFFFQSRGIRMVGWRMLPFITVTAQSMIEPMCIVTQLEYLQQTKQRCCINWSLFNKIQLWESSIWQ